MIFNPPDTTVDKNLAQTNMNTEYDPRRCCSGQERRKIDTQGIFPELRWTNMQATRESGSSSLIETSSRDAQSLH
jgi:hypothetical protein